MAIWMTPTGWPLTPVQASPEGRGAVKLAPLRPRSGGERAKTPSADAVAEEGEGPAALRRHSRARSRRGAVYVALACPSMREKRPWRKTENHPGTKFSLTEKISKLNVFY